METTGHMTGCDVNKMAEGMWDKGSEAAVKRRRIVTNHVIVWVLPNGHVNDRAVVGPSQSYYVRRDRCHCGCKNRSHVIKYIKRDCAVSGLMWLR